MAAVDHKKFYPRTRAAWRKWLEMNHEKETAVWLIYYKPASGKASISYAEAVDEALCFGWIDSKAQTIDGKSYRQFFSKRKPMSVWSGINKEKVKRLQEEGLMQPAGLAAIKTAKDNGAWTILDDVEKRIIPADLASEFKKYPSAGIYFKSLAFSRQKIMLQWLVMAKREETRAMRVQEIIAAAKKNKMPDRFA